MADFIGIDISGDIEIKQKIAALPDAAADEGVEEANRYLVEYERLYPLSTKQYFIWTSEKQRRAYFATNGFGHGIPYSRTSTLRWGWETYGHGKTQTVVNRVPYAKYVKDAQYQQIGLKDREWKTTAQDVKERMFKILQNFNKGVREAIKKVGL